MKGMKYLIIHGSFGSPQSNWIPDLKEKLEKNGLFVVAPQFPVNTWEEITVSGPKVRPTKQLLDNWLATFSSLNFWDKREEWCVVGHSIATTFMLHLLEHFNLKFNCAIFVCPFYEKLHKSWQVDLVNESFYSYNFKFPQLKKQIGISYALMSNNDPYVDAKYSQNFISNIGAHLIVIKDGGHLNSEMEITKLPILFELCMSVLSVHTFKKHYQ